jgi:Skp family chaperone for outer membrane proteins
MRFIKIIFFLLAITLHSAHSYGHQEKNIQYQDSTTANITAIPLKFITQANSKIDKYSNRITSKTEKTLQKLAKWETKIHTLLQKADPATAERLFGQCRETFASMLQKIQDGKRLAENYKAKYDAYNDKLITNLKPMKNEETITQWQPWKLHRLPQKILFMQAYHKQE